MDGGSGEQAGLVGVVDELAEPVHAVEGPMVALCAVSPLDVGMQHHLVTRPSRRGVRLTSAILARVVGMRRGRRATLVDGGSQRLPSVVGRVELLVWGELYPRSIRPLLALPCAEPLQHVLPSVFHVMDLARPLRWVQTPARGATPLILSEVLRVASRRMAVVAADGRPNVARILCGSFSWLLEIVLQHQVDVATRNLVCIHGATDAVGSSFANHDAVASLRQPSGLLVGVGIPPKPDEVAHPLPIAHSCNADEVRYLRLEAMVRARLVCPSTLRREVVVACQAQTFCAALRAFALGSCFSRGHIGWRWVGDSRRSTSHDLRQSLFVVVASVWVLPLRPEPVVLLQYEEEGIFVEALVRAELHEDLLGQKRNGMETREERRTDPTANHHKLHRWAGGSSSVMDSKQLNGWYSPVPFFVYLRSHPNIKRV